MPSQWKNIQALRVANGWTIDINNLYKFELTPDNLGWYYGEFLLCWTHRKKKVCFDSSYEPEGEPNGFLTIRFYSMDKKINSDELEINEYLGEFKTRDKEGFISVLESFMFRNEFTALHR